MSAIAWELAEYVTFVRFSSELATAYTDTLGDLALGTLGGALGAAIVGLRSPGRACSDATAVTVAASQEADMAPIFDTRAADGGVKLRLASSA